MVQKNQIQSGWWNLSLSENSPFAQLYIILPTYYNIIIIVAKSPNISDRSRLTSRKADSAINSTYDFKNCCLTGHFHCNGRFEMVDWLQRFDFSTQSTENGQVRNRRNTWPEWKNRTLLLSRNNQLHFWLLQTYLKITMRRISFGCKIRGKGKSFNMAE